ncbi:MAG TPA: type II toxin-antitoxin system RelE/ParE family toxin [Patescibacteria group bacterium]|nr:type II toxin-antitoxin system RelE/ParE family toxin [Patescibacteria group bacterium]
MKYRILLSRKAKKNLHTIDNHYKQRVEIGIINLANNAYLGKKLKGIYKNNYSYSIWPYRIIYEIDLHKSSILINQIGHRQGIYKK